MTGFKKQQGLAMIVALLVLIALTLIVLSGSRNTTMQLRMASNMQSRVEALETSQAGLDYGFFLGQTTLRTTDDLICTQHYLDLPGQTPCTKRTINLPPPLDDSATGPSNLRIEKTGGGYEEGTSISLGKKNYFRVESTFDNTSNGQGRAKLVSGIKILEFTPE
jgi:hypothetical protein